MRKFAVIVCAVAALGAVAGPATATPTGVAVANSGSDSMSSDINMGSSKLLLDFLDLFCIGSYASPDECGM
ncbi:hypothetical protein ACFXK0_00965 [Nocardia sp. NPDC059177]|uniref:hypothetical protein n=1 Tax=Nocardia sp. NPDC059177 TaxID=3346759 RepID=UPI003680C8FC